MQRMRKFRVLGDARGAALVTVLLFMVLTFILITTMLVVNGHEILIAAYHRDSVRATDFAQAGIQEALARIQSGHVTSGPTSFTSSLNDLAGVAVGGSIAAGPSGSYREITATAPSGRAIRRITVVVLQGTALLLPNATLGDSILQPGIPNRIERGDVYSKTFVQFQSNPPHPDTLTYAGWRISRCNDLTCNNQGDTGFCYTHRDCSQERWYPATRLAESEHALPDPASGFVGGGGLKLWGLLHCVNGQPTADQTKVSGRLADDKFSDARAIPDDKCIPGCSANFEHLKFGFVRDDRAADGTPIPAQAVSPKLPCGLPYQWIQRDVKDETTGGTYRRLFQTVLFEQWLDHYWELVELPTPTYVRKLALVQYPEFGAVPPYPDFGLEAGQFDHVWRPSQVDVNRFGCHQVVGQPCSSGKDELVSVWINGNWTVDTPIQGAGIIVVDGDMTVVNLSAPFELWGTIIIRGKLTVQTGQMIIHGGFIAKDLVVLNGNLTIEGGGSVATVPVGLSTVIQKSWFER